MDSKKKEVQKYEVYSLEKKKAFKQHRITKRIRSICFHNSTSTSFSILAGDSLLICDQEGDWKGTNVALPVSSVTKYIDMVTTETGEQLILSEDKKVIRIEDQKNIADLYNLETILEDTPTSLTSNGQYLSIGCLNG